MNRYLFLRRIRGPVVILVFGVTALLNQLGIFSFGQSWPLYLIALGVLQLAERAAWSQAQIPPTPYPAGAGTYTSPRGGWGGPAGPTPPPSSSALTITPPDLSRGLGSEDEEKR
ncbi:MAG: DUF5668 domain-containing protein [Silvibacterium sp.]